MAAEIDEQDKTTAELVAEAVHQLAHDVRAVRLLLERHAGLLDAYQRGGLLGMRTARKQAAREG